MTARRDPVVVTLGGRDFKIRPLTLGQVEAIEGIVADKEISGSKQGKRILAAALKRDHEDVEVDEIEGTPGELAVTVKALLKHGGFVDLPPGEAPLAGGTTATDAGGPSAAA